MGWRPRPQCRGRADDGCAVEGQRAPGPDPLGQMAFVWFCGRGAEMVWLWPEVTDLGRGREEGPPAASPQGSPHSSEHCPSPWGPAPSPPLAWLPGAWSPAQPTAEVSLRLPGLRSHADLGPARAQPVWSCGLCGLCGLPPPGRGILSGRPRTPADAGGGCVFTSTRSGVSGSRRNVAGERSGCALTPPLGPVVTPP